MIINQINENNLREHRGTVPVAMQTKPNVMAICLSFKYILNFVHFVFNLVVNHVSTWNCYASFISKYRIFPHSMGSKQFVNYKMPITLTHTIQPAFVSAFMAVRGAMVLILGPWANTKSRLLLLGTDMFPKDARTNIEYILMCWSVLCVAYMYRGTRKTLPTYNFLALFEVDPGKNIQPRDLSKLAGMNLSIILNIPRSQPKSI